MEPWKNVAVTIRKKQRVRAMKALADICTFNTGLENQPQLALAEVELITHRTTRLELL